MGDAKQAHKEFYELLSGIYNRTDYIDYISDRNGRYTFNSAILPLQNYVDGIVDNQLYKEYIGDNALSGLINLREWIKKLLLMLRFEQPGAITNGEFTLDTFYILGTKNRLTGEKMLLTPLKEIPNIEDLVNQQLVEFMSKSALGSGQIWNNPLPELGEAYIITNGQEQEFNTAVQFLQDAGIVVPFDIDDEIVCVLGGSSGYEEIWVKNADNEYHLMYMD